MDHSQHQHGPVASFFSQLDFMPHGHCYLWKPELVWTHVISDALIGLAYFSISLTLYSLVKKIRLQFSTVVLSFGVFIGACGLTHFMEIWNLWEADYWTAAWVKVITAIASVSTGIYLVKLRHPLIMIAEAAKLSEQRRIDLESLATDLESRVEERTRALQESEENLQQILENMPQMVWTTDPNGHPVYFNSRWYAYTGKSLEQTIGDGWKDLIHPDDLDLTGQAWNESLKNGKLYEVEYRIKKTDGTYRWQLGRATPLKNPQGQITQWFGTCTDIHDQKINEEHLKLTLKDRDNFLSLASHELNTPLTSLLLQTQLYERKLSHNEIGHKDFEKFLGILKRQTLRLSILVGDMLDVSKIRSQRFELKKEHLDINDFMKEVSERLAIQSDRERFQLKLSSDSLKIEFDPLRLEQVINNLFNNSNKYAPGSLIKIETKKVGLEKVQIVFQDDGPGIDQQKLETIFQQYERGSVGGESGLGLGLFIARQIINSHNGRIWAENVSTGGLRFTLELPIS